ncbi:unnamed protein product, partial [Hymenolepis diminuta]
LPKVSFTSDVRSSRKCLKCIIGLLNKSELRYESSYYPELILPSAIFDELFHLTLEGSSDGHVTVFDHLTEATFYLRLRY